MNDTLLWNQLRHTEKDRETVLPLLKALAMRGLGERFPFQGLLSPLLEGDDPEFRRTATITLNGAAGLVGIRRLVDRLNDPVPSVRAAAVESLRASADHWTVCWAHALFHARRDVRLAAVSGRQPKGTEWYAFMTLPDETCRPHVLKMLGAMRLPSALLPSLISFVKSELLPPSDATGLLAAMNWPDVYNQVPRPGRGPAAELECVLQPLDRGGRIDDSRLSPDPLDDVMDLMWGFEDEEQGEEPTSSFKWPHLLQNLVYRLCIRRAVPGTHSLMQLRTVLSIAATASRRGTWPAWAAAACAVAWPRLLGWRWVPKQVRKKAVRVLYEQRQHLPALPLHQSTQLLLGELCSRPSGNPDLWVIGGLLHFFQKKPADVLLAHVPLYRIVAAFDEEPYESISLLTAGHENHAFRTRVVEPLMQNSRWNRARLIALRVQAARSNELSFLEKLEPTEAIEALEALLEIESRPEIRLSEKKISNTAAILGNTIAKGSVSLFVRTVASAEAPEESNLILVTLGVVSREADTEAIVSAVSELDDEALESFLVAIEYCAGFSYGKEVAVALALRHHNSRRVRDWAGARVPTSTGPEPEVIEVPSSAKLLNSEQASHIATCSDDAFEKAILSCLKAPTSGVSSALASRFNPAAPSMDACLALLGAHDPIAEVAAQLERFGSCESAFLSELDAAMVRHWRNLVQDASILPWQANAWLHLWEKHCFAFGDWALNRKGQLADALRSGLAVTFPPLADQACRAVTRIVRLWGARKSDQLAAVCTNEFLEVLIGELQGDHGEVVAIALDAIYRCRATQATILSIRERLKDMLPDLEPDVRKALFRIVDSTGLFGSPSPQRLVKAAVPEEILREIEESEDMDRLEIYCLATNATIAEAALLRLAELGDTGQLRFVRLMRRTPTPACAYLIAELASEFNNEMVFGELFELLADETAPDDLRFLLALVRTEAGDDLIALVLDLARRDGKPGWFRRTHWDRLLDLGYSELDLAVALAASPHPIAYVRAVEALLSSGPNDESRTVPAVQAFLGVGDERQATLRLRAAWWLLQRGFFDGLHLLLRYALTEEMAHESMPKDQIFQALPRDLLEASVDATLSAGPPAVDEAVLASLLNDCGLSDELHESLLRRVLLDASLLTTRNLVLSMFRRSPTRAGKLARLARTFAWGVIQGRILTGDLFKVQTTGAEELGYTRFNTRTVCVSPMPILRGERNGRDVVEGLILHELGHHIYHAGEANEKLWSTARKRGLHSLLNLVADEHLERNLRANDAVFGHKLKLLNAYAFQHSERELPLEDLLIGLQEQSFEMLVSTPIRVARARNAVGIDSGQLLLEMERRGLSFPRFVRALRMGLGNRHDDPRVAEALALFTKRFRKSDMATLLEISGRLQEIFGWQTRMLNLLDQERSTLPGEDELIILGDGITEDEIQSAIDAILDPRNKADGERPTRVINMGSERSFPTISHVVQTAYDAALHSTYAASVARHARQMQRFFVELGLSAHIQRRRLQGRWIDRSRLMPLVIQRDPRVLIARILKPSADLFLGILIDCSSSMEVNENIEKAKRFGTLLAEAARGVTGIDVRIFGFTDSTIYDAGCARRCAAHNLSAGGGNNDAAALWHASRVAQGSRRMARLLVMISDGSPTECTTTALTDLVQRLTRKEHMCCAQVALAPLHEVCFPNYIELEEGNLNDSVRRFGEVIARLVRQTLRIA